MMNDIKIPFIISILLHSMVLFSVAAFYRPAKEALMDVTPLEFVQLTEEKEIVQPEKEPEKEIVIPEKEEIVPLQAKAEEEREEIENQEIKSVQDIRTDTNKSMEREQVVPPLSAFADSGVIDTQNVYTYTAPADDNIPDTANKIIRTDTNKSMEREQVVPPLSAFADSGVIDTQNVYTYTAPADDNIPDTANKINRFTNMVRSKIEKAKFYPRWARERGYEGVVGVRFVIKPDGNVMGLKVVRPCHCDVLNKAACEAIMKAAPFNPRPDELNGKEMAMEIDIGFRLE